MHSAIAPSKDLLLLVRVGFIRQGTTFTAWCNSNKINKSNARQAVLGSWDGPKGSQLRRRIVRAARIGEAA